MGLAIKICGLSTRETLDAAIAAGATHLGLNFYPPSPRHVSPETAADLCAIAQGRAQIVGVFVDPDERDIERLLSAAPLGAIQLHGRESPEDCARIRERFGLPLWKALGVSSAEDIARAALYETSVDFILFDTKTPEGALPGGMGIGFDWSLLTRYRGQTPWGLAGGLDPDNVAEAIRLTGAHLVDVSSGVESAPGKKSVDLIAAFCKAAREA